MKLDQDTAEALMRLAHNKDFQVFSEWMEAVHQVYIQGAIMGHDENNNSDVLRGRAQGISILKHEMERAPETAGRIQKIS